MCAKLNNAIEGAQRHLRAGRQSEPLACYAITKCLEQRRPILATDASAKVLLDCYEWLRQHEHLKLLAFCIMPDHYHVLFVLLHQKSLSEVLESAGKYTSTKINKLIGSHGQLWQDGFHDHRCRDKDDVLDRLTYIELNPVCAGLVQQTDQWPFSSAHLANAHLLDREWYGQRV